MEKNVGLSMMCYREGKADKTCLGDCRFKGRMGKIIVSAFSNSELSFKVIERIETVRGIKFLVIFSMATLHLAIIIIDLPIAYLFKMLENSVSNLLKDKCR